MKSTLRYTVKNVHLCCLLSLCHSLSRAHTYTHTLGLTSLHAHISESHTFIFSFQFSALNNLCIASLLTLKSLTHICYFTILYYYYYFLYEAHSHKVWPLELLQIQVPLGTTQVLLFFLPIQKFCLILQSKKIQVISLHNTTIYLDAYFESLEDVGVAQIRKVETL